MRHPSIPEERSTVRRRMPRHKTLSAFATENPIREATWCKIPAGSRWNHAGISDGFILRLFAEKSRPETANGNTYDNAMTKIFCIGKTECIYRNKSNTSSKINAIIERYILFRSSVSIYQRMTVHILYMLFHFVTAIRYASVRFVLMAI